MDHDRPVVVTPAEDDTETGDEVLVTTWRERLAEFREDERWMVWHFGE